MSASTGDGKLSSSLLSKVGAAPFVPASQVAVNDGKGGKAALKPESVKAAPFIPLTGAIELLLRPEISKLSLEEYFCPIILQESQLQIRLCFIASRAAAQKA